MCTESTGKNNTVNAVDIKLVHEQAETGIERRLGQLDCPHIVLGDGYRIGNTVAEGPAIGLYARRQRRFFAINLTIFGDDPGEIHLSQHFDNSRPANAGNACIFNSFIKALFIRPDIGADHTIARLQRFRVDLDTLNI